MTAIISRFYDKRLKTRAAGAINSRCLFLIWIKGPLLVNMTDWGGVKSLICCYHSKFQISNWDILWYIPGVKIISSKKGPASPYDYIGGGGGFGVVLKHTWCGYFIYRNTTNSINVYKFCFVKLSLAVATCICSILRTEDFFIPVI